MILVCMHMANLDIAQDNFTSIHHTYTTAIGVVAVTLAWQVTVGREAATITTTSLHVLLVRNSLSPYFRTACMVHAKKEHHLHNCA